MDDIRRVAKRAHENRIEAILREKGVTTAPAASSDPLPRLEKTAPVEVPKVVEKVEKTRAPRNSYARVVFLVLAICVLASAGFVGYKTYKTYEARKAAQGPAADDTLARVGKLVELPQGETPTVATISDLSKIKDEPFFQGAAVGDKVVIYKEAKIAILYRPSTNKVIRDAPLGE